MPPILQMILILVISVPLYICATGSIPLAAVLILKGISPGAAFVLLMAGPASNAATITMIGKVLGRRSLLVYLATIVFGAMGSGLFIDYVLPTHWFTNITMQYSAHNHAGHLAWWQIASGIVLVLLIINGYIQKYRKDKNSSISNIKNNTMDTLKIKVEGMTCNHCKSNVETNLEQLPFVKTAKVNLTDKTASIEGDDLDMAKIKETINSLGYKTE